MKSIILIINSEEKNHPMLESAVYLALFFESEIKICCFLEAPLAWEKLGRGDRDRLPEVKAKIANAKDQMDSWLKHFRSLGISSSKRFYFYQGETCKEKLGDENSNLILVHKNLLNIKAIKNTVVQSDESILMIDKVFKPTDLNYGIYNSDFKLESKRTSDILCRFLDEELFSLNLVYINTKLVNEDSAISIKNMKRIINNFVLSKTKISIFYADSLNKGLASFVEMNDTDLIIRELEGPLSLTDLNLNFTPALLINRS